MNNDSLSMVFSHLDLADIMNCLLVNKQFNYVINHRYVWGALCRRDYPIEHIAIKQAFFEDASPRSYYDTYKLCYRMSDYIRDSSYDGDDCCLSCGSTPRYCGCMDHADYIEYSGNSDYSSEYEIYCKPTHQSAI